MTQKTISIGERAIRLFTLDGRTWATSRRDLALFAARVATERRELQAQFKRIDTGTVKEIRY